MVGLILHGGCHDLPPDEKERSLTQNGVTSYGKKGYKMLLEGASAVDVAEAVLTDMEDDPLFDAGTGSFKNLNGIVEMDAIMMTDLQNCGAVHCIRNVKNPIKVARAVMEKTSHWILSGDGAEQFARLQGFPFYDPAIDSQGNDSEDAKGRTRMLQNVQYYMDEIRANDHIFSTVGIVVLDDKKNLVAATSTGGIRMKMPGRVGDSAVPGSGTYCNDVIGLSATGEGEKILRLCLTYQTAQDYLKLGDVTEACKVNITRASAIDGICGVIALTKTGEFSFAHNGVFMPVFHKTTKKRIK
ncbi:MAG: isoaspartyl peptidase/L-asparaginase family protein [Sphaerochaetaceae bacterium]|jgi:beta-aspartyl-peptidase (threonine type)